VEFRRVLGRESQCLIGVAPACQGESIGFLLGRFSFRSLSYAAFSASLRVEGITSPAQSDRSGCWGRIPLAELLVDPLKTDSARPGNLQGIAPLNPDQGTTGMKHRLVLYLGLSLGDGDSDIGQIHRYACDADPKVPSPGGFCACVYDSAASRAGR
jgi:hypothetical protein